MEADMVRDWYVGYDVVLKTFSGEILEGRVFAYDKQLQCVILSSPGTQPGSSNVKLLKLTQIKEIVSSMPPAQEFSKVLPAIDMKRVEARESKALQRAEDFVASIGEGVTSAAQEIFDAIHKTMQSKWVGSSIEVMDAVIINAPYTEKDCVLKTADGNSNALERVKHILSQITN